jgi:hypothetical protein
LSGWNSALSRESGFAIFTLNGLRLHVLDFDQNLRKGLSNIKIQTNGELLRTSEPATAQKNFLGFSLKSGKKIKIMDKGDS